ncbi:MAG TPA: HD domain-containing protein [Bacilli bacterium]
MEIIEETKKFLLLKTQMGQTFENYYPWRKHQKSIYLHSLRVHHNALRLMKSETVNEEEQNIIEMAALTHDLGKLEKGENHGIRSREIVCEWLKENPIIQKQIDCNRLLDIIASHSIKEENDNDICSQILKDADLLDELGALSIIMQVYKTNNEDPLYYYQILNNLKTKEMEYCLKAKRLIQTKSGLEYLNQKLDFIKNFILELEEELYGEGNSN